MDHSRTEYLWRHLPYQDTENSNILRWSDVAEELPQDTICIERKGVQILYG